MSGGSAKSSWFGRSFLFLGYLFLYLPIILLVVFSFNDSRVSTSWTGFSFRWYEALMNDDSMLKAAWVSLKIAFSSASAAVVLGTLAALAMRRYFRGKTLFQALITAPLVMPDIVIGLSLLLMFVTLFAPFGVSPKGMLSIWIAHVTFTMAFVTVIISSRLAELDKSLEEAAMDLGANRFKIFFVITLPIISPALISGWLMAFTLSLDDVVISSFVAGPDATTLPMKIFSTVRMGLNPKINALASIIVAVVSFTAVVAWVISTREEKRRQRDIQLALQKAD
jgi:putrescine transport system permease protein